MRKDLAQFILQQVKDNYNLCANEFSRTRSYNWEIMKELAVKYVKGGMKILDVGCGNGRLLELFGNKNVEYFGIDNSEKLIEEARIKARKLEILASGDSGRRNWEFEIADVFDLSFGENEFDIVFCIAVLHHIPSKELRQKAMNEMGRVLKPGGILIMTNWNFWQNKYWKNIFKSGYIKGRMDFGDIILKPFSGKGAPRYHHAFTKWGIKRLFKRAGFCVRECYYEKKEKRRGGEMERIWCARERREVIFNF